MDKRRLANIFLVVFIDLLGFGLILPLLPFYAEKYGATATLFGLLVAVYALAQFFGAPLLGRLSDRFGRRPVLIISIAGTSVSFLLLALAEPVGTWIAGALNMASPDAAVLGVMFASRAGGPLRRKYHGCAGLHHRYHRRRQPRPRSGDDRRSVRPGLHPGTGNWGIPQRVGLCRSRIRRGRSGFHQPGGRLPVPA